MRVTVVRDGQQAEYDDISAIGIGHERKDLVLVGASGSFTEIAGLGWTRLIVERDPASSPPQEAPNPTPAITRRITLDD